MNDNHDPEHGARGATLARILHGQQFQLDDSGLALLLVACETHTTGTRHPAVTVRTCWDADRLDCGAWVFDLILAGWRPRLVGSHSCCSKPSSDPIGMNFPGAAPSF